jgi:PEP-CTERM motif
MKNPPALILALRRSTACTSEAATIRKRIVSLSLLSAAAVTLSAGRLVADPLPPTSFPAGTTQYEILFETSGFTPATSEDISTYNSLVQSEVTPALAALDPVANWHAIMSTYTVSAATNAPSVPGIPVYTTTGQLLTDAGLYSGILEPTLNTTPNITENGKVGFELVWTGAATITPTHPDAQFGEPFTTFGWLNAGQFQDTNDQSLYALSGPIDVPNSTPEPASLALLGTGLLAVGTVRGWRRRAMLKRQSANSAVL